MDKTTNYANLVWYSYRWSLCSSKFRIFKLFPTQVKNALKILKFDEPLYGAFIELENEELNKNNKILKLEKANEQKDKQIKKLIQEKERYKKQLLAFGVSEQ